MSEATHPGTRPQIGDWPRFPLPNVLKLGGRKIIGHATRTSPVVAHLEDFAQSLSEIDKTRFRPRQASRHSDTQWGEVLAPAGHLDQALACRKRSYRR